MLFVCSKLSFLFLSVFLFVCLFVCLSFNNWWDVFIHSAFWNFFVIQFSNVFVACFWCFGVFQRTKSLFLSIQCMPKSAHRGWRCIS